MKSHLFNLHDIVLIMTMSQCILLAVLQGVIPTKKPGSHHLLTAFFILTLVHGGSILLMWNVSLQGLNLHSYLFLPIVLAASYLLKGAVLYLYLRSLFEADFKLGLPQLVHAVPLFIATAVILIMGISGNDLLGGSNNAVKGHIATLLWSAFKLSPVIYAAFCAYSVRHIRATLENHYSDMTELGGAWVHILTLGYLGHWLWSLLVHLLGFSIGPNTADTLGIVDNYLAFVMVNILFVYSLYYARSLMAATKPASQHKPSLKPSAPSQAVIDKINEGIHVKKLFLQQNINVEQFASDIGLSSRDTSQAINTHFQANFFEFINGYRVEEAKQLLVSDAHRDDTILDILYKSGFNSKSAFHRFFKRIAGMSPSEYRKVHSQR